MTEKPRPILRWVFFALALGAGGWVVYEEFFYQAPVSELSIYDEAGRAMVDGRYGRALFLYESLLERKPEHTPAIAGRALALAQMGSYRESQRGFEQLLLIEPRSAGTYANLGVVLERLGRPEDALAAYETALTLDPNLAGRPNSLLTPHLNISEDTVLPRNAITIDKRARELRRALGDG